MNVRGDDGADEEQAINYHVCFGTAKQTNAKRREEDVDEEYAQTLEHVGLYDSTLRGGVVAQ